MNIDIYQVIRSKNKEQRPLGMGNIVLIDTNYKTALACFNSTEAGVNMFLEPNPEYGVILCKYDHRVDDYVMIKHKGF